MQGDVCRAHAGMCRYGDNRGHVGSYEMGAYRDVLETCFVISRRVLL